MEDYIEVLYSLEWIGENPLPGERENGTTAAIKRVAARLRKSMEEKHGKEAVAEGLRRVKLIEAQSKARIKEEGDK